MTVKYKKKGGAGEGTTMVKPKHGAEVQKKHKTGVVETDGTLVGFKVGHTMNLGNFESAKFEVWLTLPCSEDNTDAAFKLCQEWADTKLAEVVAEAKAEVG